MSILEQYIEAKANLTKYKTLEAALRLDLLEEMDMNQTVNGTVSKSVGNWRVTGGFKLNYKLDTKSFDVSALTEEQLGCIDYKPTLVMAEYKKIEECDREELDEFITVSSAMPTVKIKALDEM